MQDNHLWHRAKSITIQTGPEITGGFDVGFDSKIPEETKDALMQFVYWVEDHFDLPITLWVDFKYKHYLISPQGKRVAYRFWWAGSASPAFHNPDDIPVIELPVRTEHTSTNAILTAFIQAISLYFAWLTGTLTDNAELDKNQVDAVLQAYLGEASI